MITVEQVRQLPLYHRATIPTSYLDVMGHMNIRWYMDLYDKAAWDFFASFGMNQAYYDTAQSGAFALKQFIRYLAEVHVHETVAIHSRLLGRSAKRLHFMHFMINETHNVLASTMEVQGAHADLILRRTTPFAPHIADQIDKIVTAHNQLAWLAPLCGVITLP